MKESDFQRKIINYFKSRAAFVFNVHGSMMQRPGIPDLLILHKKWHGFLELKVDGKLSELQRHTIKQIRLRDFPAFVVRPDGVYNEEDELLGSGDLLTLLPTIS